MVVDSRRIGAPLIKLRAARLGITAASDAIEVHLAWELVAGKSLSWTVYLDAVTGEELRIVQNFQA